MKPDVETFYLVDTPKGDRRYIIRKMTPDAYYRYKKDGGKGTRIFKVFVTLPEYSKRTHDAELEAEAEDVRIDYRVNVSVDGIKRTPSNVCIKGTAPPRANVATDDQCDKTKVAKGALCSLCNYTPSSGVKGTCHLCSEIIKDAPPKMVRTTPTEQCHLCSMALKADGKDTCQLCAEVISMASKMLKEVGMHPVKLEEDVGPTAHKSAAAITKKEKKAGYTQCLCCTNDATTNEELCHGCSMKEEGDWFR